MAGTSVSPATRVTATGRVRADTTAIPVNVAYPTGSGLLARAVGELVRTARRVREIADKLRSRAKLSREESTRVIRRVTGELAGLAEMAAAEAAAVLRNGRRVLPRLAARFRFLK